MKTGLVMEGGAMRGMFTMGVIDIMMEHGITYDGGIGVSAGAAFGCNYKSGQIGRVIRYNKAYCRDKRFSSIRSWVKTGNLFGVDFCYHELPEKLDPFDNDAYVANPMDFYVVCTDVMTGKPVYHRCDTGIGENVDWMRASASIPLFAEIVEIDGYKLLDGGIGDAVPLAYFESIGYEKNVSIEEYKNMAKKIVYTGPIDEYFNYSLGELEWRSLKFDTQVYYNMRLILGLETTR